MFYPIMVNLKNKKVVIIGGGKIGYKKAKTLLEFGGQVIIISVDFIEEFYRLKEDYKENISIIKDRYKKEYIENAFMVIAATCYREVNNQVSIDAEKLDILCNVVDRQIDSSFISQCIVNKEGLVVSTSTMGKFPYLSKKVKRDIQENYFKYDKLYMDLLEELREIVLCKYRDKKYEIFDYAIELNKNELKEFICKLKDKYD